MTARGNASRSPSRPTISKIASGPPGSHTADTAILSEAPTSWSKDALAPGLCPELEYIFNIPPLLAQSHLPAFNLRALPWFAKSVSSNCQASSAHPSWHHHWLELSQQALQ